MKKAVIFDMDGVISDTEWIYVDKVLQILSEEGVYVTGDEIHDVFGTNMTHLCSQLKERFPLKRSTEEMKERVHRLRDIHFDKHGIKPVEGAPELIRELSDMGIKIAVASSAKRAVIERTLSGFDIRDRIDAVLSGAEIERGKPWPDLYLKAAEALGMSPDECVVIEDTPPGVKGAKSAGMKCVAFAPKKAVKMDLGLADVRITDFVGLDPKILLE